MEGKNNVNIIAPNSTRFFGMLSLKEDGAHYWRLSRVFVRILENCPLRWWQTANYSGFSPFLSAFYVFRTELKVKSLTRDCNRALRLLNKAIFTSWETRFAAWPPCVLHQTGAEVISDTRAQMKCIHWKPQENILHCLGSPCCSPPFLSETRAPSSVQWPWAVTGEHLTGHSFIGSR